jgi:hypothetical protein
LKRRRRAIAAFFISAKWVEEQTGKFAGMGGSPSGSNVIRKTD